MNFFVLRSFFVIVILSCLKVSDSSNSFDISRDFKILLMYFSEAFLKGAVFDGKRLEGDRTIDVGQDLVEAIEKVAIMYPDMPDLDDLINFKDQLDAGLSIAVEIEQAKSKNSYKDLESDAKMIQSKFLSAFDKNEGIVLPFGWIGHALALVMKKGRNENTENMEVTYDFAVVNTGQGIEYHHHSADPNGVYPYLSQVWIEFVKVKAEDLFSPDAWFFQGLIALNMEIFKKKLQYIFESKSEGVSSEYFYGSFLANFKGHEAPPRMDRLAPMQRSGSCTISSMMGALLYFSKSEDNYYMYRLKIGHALIKSFLEKAYKSKKFKIILQDGFETIGRNLFKSLGSSLAQRTLEYLEFVLPNDFKHAGLIGLERFKWVFERKEEAYKALMKANGVVYESIKTSIDLINEITAFLEKNPVSFSSNLIILTDETRAQFEPFRVSLSEVNSTRVDSLSKNICEFLKGTCDRSEEPIQSFDNFYDELHELNSSNFDAQSIYRIINIFQRAHELIKDENWLNEVEKEKILSLQAICEMIAQSFGKYEVKMRSFDDISLLLSLQNLSWKLAVAYDQKLFEQKIGLESLASPRTLQSILFGSSPLKSGGKEVNILAGNLKEWIINNCFDQKNVEIFMEILEQDELKNNNIRFMGPESFCVLDQTSFQPTLPKTNPNREIYLKMMKNPEVEIIFKTLQTRQSTFELWGKWADVDPIQGKFMIAFCQIEDKLFNDFPHYYNLMNTLSHVRRAAVTRGNSDSYSFLLKNYWITCESSLTAKLTRSSNITNYINYYKNKSHLELIEDTSYRRKESIFYRARHSLALTENIDIVSLETWFNYIKDASSAKLFDSAYFQYTTDHLLNVPKLDKNGRVMFPIDEFNAQLIIEELSRLIKVSLELLKAKNEQLSSENRKTLIHRSVNVSVILTRFISRIDSENILIGSLCAKYLARIYNFIVPFANFKTLYFLEEQEICRINFSLAHICSIFIRNPLTFMDNIELGTNRKGIRKTLKRYHWFAAKKNYVISGINESVADDQFNYGTSLSSMTADETSFLKELLITYFLPGLINESSLIDAYKYTFKYNYRRNLVHIQDLNGSGVDVIINLRTGAVVLNGFCIVDNDSFIRSNEFRNYFGYDDLALLSKGKTFEAGGKLIYALPDFKGSSYLLSRDLSGGSLEIKIHRKWNGNWYDLIPFYKLNFGLDLDYDWIKNDSWIFTRQFGQKSREIIIILKGEIDPVMRFIIDENTSTIKVFVDGFNENNDWTVLSRGKRENNLIRSAGLKLQRHLDSFTRGVYILAKDDNDRFVIICMNMKSKEDARRPIVFREKNRLEGANLSDFEILNMPNTEISADQSLNEDSFLPGGLGLVIVSDSKKVLILANAQKNQVSTTAIQIEKIPILSGKLAPQSRKHKLLLAYYMILQFEFRTARELLHPSASIHQNEVFSIEEVNILNWIAGVELEAPEALALKMFAFFHFENNRAKFSSEHLKHKLLNVPFPNATPYLFALREMSEKYYIFLIFPEILREPFLRKLLDCYDENIEHLSNLNHESQFNELDTSFPISNNGHSYQVGDRIESNWFISQILSKNFDRLKFASRFIIRRSKFIRFVKGSEMSLFCYVQDTDLWTNFKEKLFSLAEGNMNYLRSELSSDYKNLMKDCIKKYWKFFNGINESVGSTVTGMETLKATLEAETNRLKLNIVNNSFESELQPLELVSSSDIKFMTVVEANLRNVIRSDNSSDIEVNFDSETLHNSTVLAKLKKSIEKFAEEKGQSSQFEVNLTDSFELLRDLENFFEIRIIAFTASQEDMAFELSASINAETYGNAVGSILNLMHQKKVKTFESLYACYLKDSLVCIQKKFPQLDLKQCMEVKEKAKIFYSRLILINYYEMLKKSVENFLSLTNENKLVSVDDLNIFCDELSKIKDFNSRMKDPVIMNFEFRSGKYCLKPEQVKDIELLTAEDPKTKLFPSIVIQRMMAAGKTLVLGTISVIKKALSNTQLSILVPPSSLYQSNTTAMQNRTYQYFKKKGVSFTFSRFNFQDFDSFKKLETYLGTLIQIITDTMKDKNYLILSPETLHSFLNSYIEVLLTAGREWDAKYQNILTKYAQIYRIFRQRGSIILDEIDMTMDPKKELNFPTQKTESYNMMAVTMLTDIMEFLIFDEEIIKIGLQIHSNNQASLTANNYRLCVNLILQYIENQLRDTSSLWYNLVYGSQSHNATVNDIMKFLNDPNLAGEKEWITNFYESGNEIIANSLIIVKNQLYCEIEHSLKGTVNQNFGSAGSARPEIKYAVPDSAANTPSNASVFADRWETLIKTLLMISASPCSHEIAKDFLDYSRIAISSESASAPSLETTITYKNFKLILPNDICPLSLDSKNIIHVQLVQKALATRSPAAIRLLFSFYITQVFDKMNFPTEQITSNALNVTSMFNSVQGYSGTIDNVNILPQNVVKDALEDHLNNEKNNGGISLKLIKDSGDRKVEELSETSFMKSAEDMIRDLMLLYPSENVSAIIDTGAFFKNFKNIQVAKAILNACSRIKVVLYYDENSNQLEFLRQNGGFDVRGILETTDPDDIKRATEVELNERFTFYDQRHITGSDILQPKTAHAIMTTGPRVLLRDILQGALRMRQFMTSQKVHIVTTEASRNFYCSKIKKNKTEMKVEDILTLGALNEEEKQDHENVKLAFGKINAEIRGFVLDEISRSLLSNPENSPKFVSELVSSTESLFLRSIREVPLNWLQESKDENASKILNYFALSQLNPLKKVINNLKSNFELQQRFNTTKKRIKDMISPSNMKYFYAKSTIHTPINLENGSEVQQQTLTLTMVDLNMDQLLEPVNPRYAIAHKYEMLKWLEPEIRKTLVECNDVYLSLKELYYENYKNEKYKNIVENILMTSGDRVGVSQDLVRIIDTEDYPIFSKYTFEGSHFLVQIFDDILKVFLISSKHASNILNEIEHATYSTFWLCDLSGSVTITNDIETERGENIIDIIPQIDYLIFDLLVFNGSLPQILGNPKLKVIYKNWLKSTNFKTRAIFLRIRMEVLMKKHEEIFETDDLNFGILKKYSQGINNFTEKVVEGYPKNAIEIDYESYKIKNLNISFTNQQKALVEKIDFCDFDFTTEIHQLLNIPDVFVEKSVEIIGSDFVYGSEDSVIKDVDYDPRDINVKSFVPSTREIIAVAPYDMAEKVMGKCEVRQEEIREDLETDILVDESIADYEEPILPELNKMKIWEIMVNLA